MKTTKTAPNMKIFVVGLILLTIIVSCSTALGQVFDSNYHKSFDKEKMLSQDHIKLDIAILIDDKIYKELESRVDSNDSSLNMH